MLPVQKIFIACLAFLLLIACGLKGDLYLPEAQPQVVDTPVEATETATESSVSEPQETQNQEIPEESPKL